MSWIDLGIFAVFAVSIAISISRGFIREAFSLAAWMLAVVCSRLLAPKLAGLFPGSIESLAARLAVASAVLFILTLMVGNMIGRLAQQLLKSTGLSAVDRFLGVLFGAVRAMIIVLLAVIVLHWLGWFEKTQAWQTSRGLPYFLALEDWFLNLVKIRFHL